MIPPRFTLHDIQDSFRDVQQKLEALLTRNVDMQGRRIINAGEAIGDFDYVRKFELDKLTASSSSTELTGLLNANIPVRFGLFAARGPAIAYRGKHFAATDHNYMTWFSTGAAWIYAFGIKSVVQADIAAFVAVLGTNDAGALINVTDFTHMLRWTGTATEFAPGDPGSGQIAFYQITPPGGTWGICDGSTYSYLQAAATLANFTTPNYGTAAYIKAGTSAAAIAAASGVTGSTTATNQAEAAHTHAIDPASTTSGAPSAVTNVDNNNLGSTVDVGSSTHTHATDIASFSSGAGSSHNHTQDAHTHGPGSLELRNSQLTAFFRR